MTNHEKPQIVDWSYSRRSTLEQCNRRYYYEYFGANKLTAKGEVNKEQLHFLKNRVHNRFLLSGGALHTVIRSYFLNAKKGDFWNEFRLTGFAKKIFQESKLFSQKNPDGKFIPKGQYPPKLLEEFYSQHPNANELCNKEETRLLSAIHSFATHEKFTKFRLAGCKKDSLIEHKIKINNFPCSVSGVIDLVYREDDKVIIVDWKLGENDGLGDDSLQLAVYALWACYEFNFKPEKIQVFKAYLSNQEVVEFKADANTLASARFRIIQDAKRLELLNFYGNNSEIEAFTRCEKPAICNMCSFRSICYDRN